MGKRVAIYWVVFLICLALGDNLYRKLTPKTVNVLVPYKVVEERVRIVSDERFVITEEKIPPYDVAIRIRINMPDYWDAKGWADGKDVVIGVKKRT